MDTKTCETITEATSLLQELVTQISATADDATDETAATDAVPAEQRFKHDGLNKLDARVRNAEENARALMEKRIKAETDRVRISTATTLCGEIGRLLATLGPSAPSPAEAATGI